MRLFALSDDVRCAIVTSDNAEDTPMKTIQIPQKDWREKGSWKHTLKACISAIEKGAQLPTRMTIMTTDWSLRSRISDLNQEFPSLESHIYSYDKRQVVRLEFSGDFNVEVLLRLINELTSAGLKPGDSDSLSIHLE
jgi:hypothetical protein